MREMESYFTCRAKTSLGGIVGSFLAARLCARMMTGDYVRSRRVVREETSQSSRLGEGVVQVSHCTGIRTERFRKEVVCMCWAGFKVRKTTGRHVRHAWKPRGTSRTSGSGNSSCYRECRRDFFWRRRGIKLVSAYRGKDQGGRGRGKRRGVLVRWDCRSDNPLCRFWE